jgi:type I restriction enzyme, S subunit
MNADGLLAHFKRVADAPDAIDRLRQFILDIAVRGRLVPQDPTDEPTTELLQRIAFERSRKPTDAGARPRSELLLPAEDDAPFDLPIDWRWVRLGSIVDFSAGRTPSRNDTSFWNTGDYAWVSIADLPDGETVTATKETVSQKARERVFGSDPEPSGTIVMSFKLTIGKIARLGIPAFHNEAIISIKAHLPDLHDYLFKVVPQFAREGNTKGAIKGATLNRHSISNILLPLPPVAEQRRIVAKVDELMKMCDRLEAARAEREAKRDRLAAASVARLNTPDSDEAKFASDARFAINILPALTERRDQIQRLRQTILNLAVRGTLVPQNPTDVPATEWLQTVSGPKASPGRDISPPFSVPERWIWVRVADVFEVAGGIQKTPHRAPRQNAYPYLGVANVYRGRLDLANVKKFELEPGELQRRRLEAGDIVIIEGNGSLNEIGRCAKWNGEIKDCVHQNHVIRCRPCDVTISDFVLLFLNSPYGSDIMQRLAITSSGLYSLSVGKIRQIEIPLPSLAEQQRIVAKVDELMALCNQLEASLSIADFTRSRMLDALLADALAPVASELQVTNYSEVHLS